MGVVLNIFFSSLTQDGAKIQKAKEVHSKESPEGHTFLWTCRTEVVHLTAKPQILRAIVTRTLFHEDCFMSILIKKSTKAITGTVPFQSVLAKAF